MSLFSFSEPMIQPASHPFPSFPSSSLFHLPVLLPFLILFSTISHPSSCVYLATVQRFGGNEREVYKRRGFVRKGKIRKGEKK